MITVTVPAALATAPRRSWFLDKFQDIEYGLLWKQMLTELAPRQGKRLDPFRPLDCWKALLIHCSTLFPVSEPIVDEWEDDSEYSAAAEAWAYGVPVSVQGIDYEMLHYGRSPAIALALLYTEYGNGSDPNRAAAARNIDTLKNVSSLQPYIAQPMAKHWRAAYDSRTWAPPWDEAGLFLDYCYSNTGYAILDWSELAVNEGGGYPEWSVEEIRGNAKEWKKAEPVLKRILKFRDYVDKKPQSRLPVLAGILTANPAIIETYSTPKRLRAKTLAEVFAPASASAEGGAE